jgi:hypothetical protein
MKNRRKSPAILIAVVALVVALAGTSMAGYAAGKASGDSLIKKKSLSGNRLKADTVTGNQVSESSLGNVPSATHAAKADLAVQADHAASADRVPATALTPYVYGSVWHQDPATTRAAGYRKDGSGFVHLQGSVAHVSGVSIVMVVLPPGFRPADIISFPALTASGPGSLLIDSAGNVVLTGGSTATVSLEGVTFYPDA